MLAKKESEHVVYREPPRKRDIGGSIGIIVGLIGLLAGLYPLLRRFGVHNFGYNIPELWMEILLAGVSLFLILEAGKRQTMVRAKRRYDRLLSH